LLIKNTSKAEVLSVTIVKNHNLDETDLIIAKTELKTTAVLLQSAL
jgi:hypothetical protein